MVNTPNNKRKQDSRMRICRAFLELLQKKKRNEIKISEICRIAGVNRTTFYNNYDNISEVADDIRKEMIREYIELYAGNNDGHTAENYLKMFQHIKDNQIFYRIYFLLSPDSHDMYHFYDRQMARAVGKEELIDYHIEFFAAGITALIKKWLNSGCKESPEEILNVLVTEYGNYPRQSVIS